MECLTNNNCEIDDICLDNVCVAPGPLDNIWLELKISSKASAVDADNGTLEKETIKTTAYMNIRQDGDVYQYIIICEIAPDVWSDTQHGSIPLANPTEDSIFMDGTWWELATQNGTPIRVLLSGQFKLKLQNGELKKAAFSSLGAYIADSDTKIPLYGGIKITGKTIDEDKLPALN